MKLTEFCENSQENEPSQLRRVWVRFGVIGLFLIAAFIFSPFLEFDFIIPALLILCSIGFVSNVILLFWVISGKGLKQSIYYATFIDVLLITAAVHYLGGIENTFSWVYVLALIAVALLHGVKMGLYLALVSSLLYSGLLYAEFLQIIPHVNINRINPIYLYDDKSYLYTKLLSNYILFFTTAGVSGLLSQRLLRSKNRLEITVKERTKELLIANEKLQQEISERRRTEEALRESEQKLRSMVELTSDWIWETDQHGIYKYASPKVKEILGYEPEEIIGKTPFDILAPEEAEQAIKFYMERAKRKEPFIHFENTNIRKDGERMDAETSGIPIIDSDGKLMGYRGVDRDITERRRAEKELKDSEERLKILFEYAPDAYYLNDLEGRFIDGNKAAEKLIGYSKNELIGKSFLELNLLLPEQLHLAAEYLAQSANNKATGPVELILNRKDGTQVMVEVTTFPVNIKNQFMSLGIARDITERKRAEEALRFTKFSIDRCADAAFWMGADARLIYVNEAACRSLGYSRAELLSMSLHDIDANLSAEIWVDHWKEIKDRGSFTIESQQRTKDGRIFPVEVTENFLEFEGKEYNCAFVHDISTRKNVDKALEESLSLLRATLESTADGIMVVNTKGHIQSFNQKYLEMWGIPEQFIASSDDFGIRIHILNQLKNPEKFIRKAEELYDHPDRESFAVIELKNDRIFEWYMMPQIIGGETVGIVQNFRDVTERRRAEALLKQSEEKYRTLFEESRDIVYISTPDGQILEMNPAGIELFGYSSKDEVMKSNIEDLYVNPDDRIKFKKIMKHQGFAKDLELILKNKDGQPLNILVTSNAVLDKNQDIVAYRGIMRDVTEQKKLEQQFIQAQKMESVGTLAGGIAHDFNNILSGILGYASFMKSKISEDHPHYRYVDTIEKSSRRAAELTAQLLGFARGGKYNARPINLNNIVNEVLQIVSSTFDKAIIIQLDLFNSLPTVAADAGQLQQVIMNLCVNAGDAMAQGGGRLTIKTNVEELNKKYVDTHPWAKEGSYVCLSVKDTGIGMEKETSKRVFEPFFTTKEEGKGTGLGLSMVYGVVKNHGGYIDVISKPNQGTEFNIYLPICGEAEENGSSQDAEPASIKELILIADDEESIRAFTKDMLEVHGYRVLLAEDGTEAVDIYEKYNGEISLTILDLAMPGMGGHKAFLKLKERNPNIRAILSTGHGQNEETQKILNSGFMGFIQKPYRSNTLLKKIRSVLDAQN